jgi:maltose-binding protein MalE
MNGLPNPQLTRRTALIGMGGAGIAAFLAACTAGGTTPAATQKLTFWMDSVFAEALEKAVTDFRDEFGVSLDIQPTAYGDIIGNYLQGAPGGSGPDLADFNIDHLGPLSKASLAAPLDFGDKLASLDPRAVAGYTVDGQMLGMPLVLESTNVWRNPSLIPDPVTDWAAVATTAADLQGKVEYPFVMDGGGYTLAGMLTAFGGYVFKQNPDGSYDVNDVGLDNPGSIAAFQFLADGVAAGWIKFGLEMENVGDAWAENQVGLHFSGPWMYNAYADGGAEFAVDAVPNGPGGTAVPWLSARGLVVNPVSKNAALAATFLTEYLAANDPMATFAEETAKQSAWLPVQETAANDATRAFSAASVNAQPIPQNAELAGYWTPSEDAVNLVLQGQSTPAEICGNLAAQLRDAVAAAQ